MSGLFAGTPLERPITCPRCGRAHVECACPRGRNGKVLDPKDQPVRVRRERRGGKTVTVAAGFSPRSDRTDDLPALLVQLKKMFATGGKLESSAGEIELQGDHRDKLVIFLITLGYPAKPAGG